MEFIGEDLLKLGLAMVVGGVLGAEREFRDKAAGFRTMILITVGATLFTIFSHRFAGSNVDASRIASNIVTGVGFLGAGAILRDRGRVLGLTTAATIWLAAALGMGIGAGEYAISITATVVVALVLFAFRWFEALFARRRQEREYCIRFNLDLDRLARLREQVKEHRLTLIEQRNEKKDEELICRWRINGPPEAHRKLLEAWLKDADLHEVGN